VSISQFVPEIWSASLLENLKKTLVYGGCANRDYEGDIAQAGDTVHITSISRPTIRSYTPNSQTIVVDEIFDASRALVIDQMNYAAFKIDDVDARQAKGNVIPAATLETSYGLAESADRYVASLYTGIQAANQVNAGAAITITGGTGATAWTQVWDSILVPLSVKLDEANVPRQGRWAVLPPWLQGAMIRDDRFVRVDASGVSEGLRNGMVGRAAGFDILLSNNCPVPSANQSVVIAGNNSAITYAEQILKMEAYRPEASFSDAVKFLHVFGAKLVRPDSLAYAVAASA
jgi:hypothetical protein